MEARHRVPRLVLLGLIVVVAQLSDAVSAELKILCPRSISTVLNEIGHQFERTSGYRLNVMHGIAASLADRIVQGESFDIFIGPPVQIERVIKKGKIVAGTRVPIARSGIGVEVRAGAPKPDISSVEEFKRALLNAKSIGYLKQKGTSGEYLHGLFERLGIADAIRAKVVRPETDIVSQLVAKGGIELGMVVTTQIITTPGVELVGPIPQELQHYVRWSGGVSTQSRAQDEAKGLISFLRSPAAMSVIKAQGMEPE